MNGCPHKAKYKGKYYVIVYQLKFGLCFFCIYFYIFVGYKKVVDAYQKRSGCDSN